MNNELPIEREMHHCEHCNERTIHEYQWCTHYGADESRMAYQCRWCGGMFFRRATAKERVVIDLGRCPLELGRE